MPVNLKTTIGNMARSVGDTAKNAIGTVGGAVSEVAKTTVYTARNVGKSTKNVMFNAFESVSGTVGGVTKNTVDTVKQCFVAKPKTPEEEEATYLQPWLEEENSHTSKKHHMFSMWGLLFVGISLYAVTSFVNTVLTNMSSNPAIGIMYLVACSLMTLVAVLFIRNEFISSKTLRRQDECLKETNPTTLFRFLGRIPLNHDTSGKVLQEWKNGEIPDSAPKVRIEFSNKVLIPTSDPEVRNIILNHAISSAGLVVLSPFALGDMLIMLVGILKMTKAISEEYGIQLGWASRITLYKKTLKCITVAGVTESLTEVLSRFGAGGMGVMVLNGTQAVISARAMIRIGISVAMLCRPVPFTPSNCITYGDLFKDVIAKLISQGKVGTKKNADSIDSKQVTTESPAFSPNFTV